MLTRRIPRHQPGMDVWLFVQRSSGLCPDLFSEIKYRVDQGGRYTRKRQSVGYDECSTEKIMRYRMLSRTYCTHGKNSGL